MRAQKVTVGRVVAIAALALVVGRAVRAQTTPPEAPADANLTAEIAGMRRSMDRLVELLDQVVAQQRIDILLKRIDITQRALIPLSSDLRALQARYDERKSDLRHMREAIESQQEQVERDVMRGIDQPDSDSRTMLREFQQAFEIEIARTEELERRIRGFEDELAEGQDRIEDLTVRLDELLGE